MSAAVVTVRKVLHPGFPTGRTVATVADHNPRRIVTWLEPGKGLGCALLEIYRNLGTYTGAFQIIGGTLKVAAYHLATPHANSLRVIEYGSPILIDGGANVIAASGSVGSDLSGGPLLHIHGTFADRDGRAHGGHINPDLCIIGGEGMRVTILSSLGFRQRSDEETGFSLFFPCRASSAQ